MQEADISGHGGTAPVVLITGASRGIGAETARLLSSRAGARIIVNYREKRRRADAVVADITGSGGEALAARADLTEPAEVAAMLATIKAAYGRIDVLVLNASGGMERDADPGYALRLNRDAQLHLADGATDLMPAGARIVFVTSHQAHFHGQQPAIEAYEPVARSKRAGEDALRAKIPELSGRGIDLVVVSGDMIEGTTTVMLLDRAQPGLVTARRAQVGSIPTIGEFAGAVVAAATRRYPAGHTIYVGGPDYLAAHQDRAAQPDRP
ncbi:MAG TPA: SDR family oxidoreductase [Streptosporangiaceae bacterium]|nr:SDR family oxidoreductase [Streptosporangiaceae bacterium]